MCASFTGDASFDTCSTTGIEVGLGVNLISDSNIQQGDKLSIRRLAAVVFDLDDTLYAESLYLTAVLEQSQIDVSLDLETAAKTVKTLDLSQQDDVLGFVLGEQGLNTRRNHDALFAHYCNLKQSLELPEESAHVLASLRSWGIAVGVLTNGNPAAQSSKVKALRLEERVDSIVYARALGKQFEKPDTSAFRRSLDALGVTPARALFVGDNPRTDIAGGSAVGMMTALLTRERTFSEPSLEDFRIENLLGLVEDFPRYGIIWDGET